MTTRKPESKMLRSVRIQNYLNTFRNVNFVEYNNEIARHSYSVHTERILKTIDIVFRDYLCSLFVKERIHTSIRANILFVYDWLRDIKETECKALFDLLHEGFNSASFNKRSCEFYYVHTCWNICEFVRSCRTLVATKIHPEYIAYVNQIVPVIMLETPLIDDVICEILSYLKCKDDDIMTRKEVDTIVYSTNPLILI